MEEQCLAAQIKEQSRQNFILARILFKPAPSVVAGLYKAQNVIHLCSLMVGLSYTVQAW